MGRKENMVNMMTVIAKFSLVIFLAGVLYLGIMTDIRMNIGLSPILIIMLISGTITLLCGLIFFVLDIREKYKSDGIRCIRNLIFEICSLFVCIYLFENFFIKEEIAMVVTFLQVTAIVMGGRGLGNYLARRKKRTTG